MNCCQCNKEMTTRFRVHMGPNRCADEDVCYEVLQCVHCNVTFHVPEFNELECSPACRTEARTEAQRSRERDKVV